jgi:hypothetical protein
MVWYLSKDQRLCDVSCYSMVYVTMPKTPVDQAYLDRTISGQASIFTITLALPLYEIYNFLVKNNMLQIFELL